MLRAIAAMSSVPRLTISALGVIYAFAWLLSSIRGRSNVARAVYAGTSALILLPLLWENTVRFHVLPSMMSAGALAAFLTLATLLEVRSGSPPSMWIAQIFAAFTSAALAFASRDLLPFVTTLLIAVLVSEIARIRDYAQPLWPLMVLVADTSIWSLMFIYSGPQSMLADYPRLGRAALLAPAFSLFAINGTATAMRALVQESRISIFEVLQIVVAFLLGMFGMLTFGGPSGLLALGIFSLMLAGCAYAAGLRYLRHTADQRNFRVFGIWSATLLIAGSLWALPHSGASIVLALAALAATYLACRLEPQMFEFQAALFLVAAAIIAGSPRYVFAAVAGSPPQRVALDTGIVCICAVIAFLIMGEGRPGASAKAFRLLLTLGFGCAMVALMVHGGLAGAAAFIALDPQHVAFLRTLTICIAVVAMAFAGARWGRPELTHMAYLALAFVAAKLLFEDLRHGRMVFIAGSIAVFAIALIAAPRLVRWGERVRTRVRDEALVPIHH